MIEYVVKRNGETEEFNAEKLNSMASWAIEAAPEVSWSDIVVTAIRNLSAKTVSAKDLQESLIKTCLDFETPSHNKVAGRLLLGDLRRSTLADQEDFLSFYTWMVDKGYWRDMNYSDEEVEYLGTKIDHDTDLGYGYPTLRQFKDKYCVKDENEVILELPQYMYMGVAMSLFEEDSLEDVVMYYDKASQQKINIPSPVLTGQRTNSNVGVSCVITTAGDSVQGIEATKHIASICTAHSAGMGVEYAVRSKGDTVRKGYAQGGGQLPHLRVLDKLVDEFKQMSRGGSATVSVSCLDPEIETLLNLKLKRTPETKRIDMLDYSLVWNNTFLKYAAKKKDWALVSRTVCPELYEAFDSNDEGRFSEVMEKVLSDESIKKKVVNALDILIQFIDNRDETGRLYRFNHTEVNSHTPFLENIRLSNLCVVPETEILTKQGYVPIFDLEGENVDVWNGEEWSNVLVSATGKSQKIIKVTTSAGQSLECTPYHKFYVKNSYWQPHKEVRACDLTEGDKLIKFDLPVIEGELKLDKAYENGFYSADGCIDKGRQKIYLYHEKRRLKPYFKDIKWSDQEEQERSYGHYSDLKDKFFVPSTNYTISSRLKWLAGYLDGDGCVYRNGTNEALTACSVEFEFLKSVQLMLQTLGVSCKISKVSDEGFKMLPANDGGGGLKKFWCKEAYRLLISSCDTFKLLSLGLKLNRLKVTKRLPSRDAKHFNTVVTVVDEGRVSDTYCFKESKRGMGMFNGILTGQCQEVCLPTHPYNSLTELYKDTYEEGDGITAQCFLSAVVLGNVTDDKDYEETAYILAKSLDNLINNMDYPFPQFKATGQGYRSIGVGLSNLAHYLVKSGKTYSDVGFLHDIAERHYYFMLKASVKLAKERGEFEFISKTKWKDGWTPLETYNINLDNVVGKDEEKYDWLGISEEIKKTGVRFSTLVANMPCESSAVLTNSTNSLYPIRQKLVYKSSKKGSIQFFAPDCDKYDYESAYNVEPYTLLNMYGIFQKWADQSTSADTYLDLTKIKGAKVPLTDSIKLQLYGNKIGIKTLYYANTKTGRGDGGADETLIESESDCESCKL